MCSVQTSRLLDENLGGLLFTLSSINKYWHFYSPSMKKSVASKGDNVGEDSKLP